MVLVVRFVLLFVFGGCCRVLCGVCGVLLFVCCASVVAVVCYCLMLFVRVVGCSLLFVVVCWCLLVVAAVARCLPLLVVVSCLW